MRLILLFLSLTILVSCSYIPKLDEVLPDKRTEYKKSESLPDLEIPPDLTADAARDAMTIPGEDSASLTRYQRQRSGQPLQPAPTTAAVTATDEQWISVRGTNMEVWPKLKDFFNNNGYELDLDDAELGVMETSWAKPVTEAGIVYRDKFKVFSEPGGETDSLVLYINNLRQQQVHQTDGTTDWVEHEKSTAMEKQLAGELNLHFNGNNRQSGASAAVAGSADVHESVDKAQVKIMETDDGKLYLAIADEFTLAWRRTEQALQRAGFAIDSKDLEKGLYMISYYDAVEGKKKGWLSKLTFWKDDEGKGVPYQISLTGVGDKTELIVLNGEGNWESDVDSDRILSLIQDHYNR